MSTGVLILISAIGLLSSFVSGIFGMAGGQILLASLLLFLPVASSLVVFAAVQICGAFVMTLQLTVGQGGNILDVFFQASPLDRKSVVATKAVTQLFSQVVRVFYFGAFAADAVAEIPIWAWACFMGTAIAGTSLAPLVLHRMTDANFRKYTKTIIIFFSALYVARGLWLLVYGE